MKPGKLVLINGGSSAGKTSMALEFQEIIEEPYFLLGIDVYWFTMPQKEIELERVTPAFYSWCEEETASGLKYFRILPGHYLNEIMLARYRSMAAYLERGLNVIADEVFWSRDWLLESLRVLEPFECYYVGITCDDAELARREIQRGDRWCGWARGSQIYAHKDARYDLHIDSTAKTPLECAQEIKQLIESGTAPKAANEMRESLKSSC